MSRSFKKNPIWNQNRKGTKRSANKKVRKYLKTNIISDIKIQEIADGSAYKKIYDSYDISDICIRTSYKEYKADFESEEKSYINEASIWNFNPKDWSYIRWFKTFRMK